MTSWRKYPNSLAGSRNNKRFTARSSFRWNTSCRFAISNQNGYIIKFYPANLDRSTQMTKPTGQNKPRCIVKSYKARWWLVMEKADFIKRLVALRVSKGASARDMSLSLGQSAGYIPPWRFSSTSVITSGSRQKNSLTRKPLIHQRRMSFYLRLRG